MIGMNYDYPEASWERRQEIIKAHKDYTLGLLYFTAHDERIPAQIRNYVAQWGLPRDEYVETDHWTPQLYVRESRRMVGEYVATQPDRENVCEARDGIAMAAYTMDSHNCQRIVVKKNGKYTKAAAAPASAVKCTVKKLKKGKTFFKLKAFRNINGKKVWSEYSEPAAAKIR